LKIIGVNIILSGDNAVVIALAARSLPVKQQKQAILWGAGAAVILRIILTIFAVALLTLPWLKIVGSLLLFWIGIKLLVPEDGDDEIQASDQLLAAVKTILVADLVMSLDNVIAVAAAAGGSYLLLILGLAISIPLVVFGATLLFKLMECFPIIITIGAGLIGWVAGEMLVADAALPAGSPPWAWSTRTQDRFLEAGAWSSSPASSASSSWWRSANGLPPGKSHPRRRRMRPSNIEKGVPSVRSTDNGLAVIPINGGGSE